MLIKLPITQIPSYWNLIKIGTVKSDNVKDEDVSTYCKNLLLRLYKKDIQCILKCDEDKQIQAVILISFKMNKLNSEKFMQIDNLFAVSKVKMEDWQVALEQLVKFARNEDCGYVTAESGNKRIWEILDKYSFIASSKKYTLRL